MKICVSSNGKSEKASMDERFGRCMNFVLFDTETNEYGAAENKGIHASGGAGIAAAQTIIDLNADVVLTGNIGPNAMKLLEANGIKVYRAASGTVEEAVTAFQGENKSLIDKPVPEHFGMGRNGRRGR